MARQGGTGQANPPLGWRADGAGRVKAVPSLRLYRPRRDERPAFHQPGVRNLLPNIALMLPRGGKKGLSGLRAVLGAG